MDHTKAQIEARYRADLDMIQRASAQFAGLPPDVSEQCFSVDDYARQIDLYLAMFETKPIFSITSGTGER